MIIKGITFDLEGTCVNLEIAHHMAHIKAAAAVGVYLDIRSSIASLPHFIGGPDEEVAREIYDLSDKKEPASSILARKRHFYDQLVEGEKIEPRPGLIEILEELKGAGFKMAIGSVTPNQQAEIILAKSGLIGHFDRKNIILGNDIKGRHSKSDIFAETARRMGIKPDEQLVFDDSPHGILSARSKAPSRSPNCIDTFLCRLPSSP